MMIKSFLVVCALLASLALIMAEETDGGPKVMKFPVKYNPIRLTVDPATETITSVSGGDYVAQLQLGSPAQTVYAILDTGSSNLVVADSNYGLTGFPSYYEPAKSTTARNTGQAISISYGSGDISGTVYTDDVTLNGDAAGDVEFMVITSEDHFFFDNSANSALLGLAFRSIANNNIEPLMDVLYAQKKIPTNALGLQLCRSSSWSKSSGTFVMGGSDSSLYTGALNELPLTPPGGVNQYYSVTFDGVTLDGASIGGQNAFIVDSGTNSLLFDEDYYTAFQEKASAQAGVSADDPAWYGGGLFCGIDLAKWPHIEYAATTSTLAKITLSVPPQHYLEPYSYNGEICYLPRVMNSGSVNLVGTPMLNTYYAYFSKTDNSVSFAEIDGCADLPGPPPPFGLFEKTSNDFVAEPYDDFVIYNGNPYAPFLEKRPERPEIIIEDDSTDSSSSVATSAITSAQSGPSAMLIVGCVAVVAVVAIVAIAVVVRRRKFAVATTGIV